MKFDKLVEIGLSGWIIFLVALLLGGGAIVITIRWRKSTQKNISAGGDIAGGDIVHSKEKQSRTGIDSKTTIQSDIKAKGDVAGGDIYKGHK